MQGNFAEEGIIKEGPMEGMYITVTGFARYYGKEPFRPGNVLICEKEPSNKHDSEAIAVKLPIIGCVGYVANSASTVASGTMSGGRLYDRVEDVFYIRVLFATQSKIICRVESNDPDILAKEIQTQIMSSDTWLQKKK